MAIRLAINGFGRIGRLSLRAISKWADLEVVAINDLTSAKTLAHLLKYDSIHGRFDATISSTEKSILINGHEIEILSEKDPAKLPWKDKKVDVVLECTGKYTDKKGCSLHLAAGAKRVLISAPAKDPDMTICMGINHLQFDPEKHFIISNASCTTNCLAPVAKVLLENFGIRKGLMTTIHAYTNDQRILDLEHKDLRRARAAGLSMIPTTTGAAKAVALVLPELEGKFDGIAIRVPTPNVSLVDLVAELEKEVTKEEVNAAFLKASQGDLKGIMECCEEPLVSIDFNGNPHSSIVDMASTFAKGNMVKVFAWYDNEWGYSLRLVDLARYVSK